MVNPSNRTKSDVQHELVFYARNIGDGGTFAVELAGETLPYDRYFIPRIPGGPHVFEYVLSGKGYIEADGVIHPVQAGDFYMISTYSNLSYYSDFDDPYQKIYLNCRGTLTRSLCQAYDMDYPYFIYPFAKAEKHIRHIHNVLCDPTLALETRDATCGFIVHEMLEDLKIERQKTDHSSQNTAHRIRNFLDLNICEKITLEDLVKTFFISKTHLITLFRESFGVSPYQYLLSQRIDMACSLLRNSTLSITEITKMLQFADAHYFSSFFKSKIGMSPTDYRNHVYHQ